MSMVMSKILLLNPHFSIIVEPLDWVYPRDFNVVSVKTNRGERFNVLIKKGITYKAFELLSSCSFIVAKFNGINIVIAACYLSWRLFSGKFREVLDSIFCKAKLFNPDIIIFVGDFNASALGNVVGYTRSGGKGSALKYWCEANSFVLPTYTADDWTFRDSRGGLHIIDHLFFNSKLECVRDKTCYFETRSDHRLMVTSIKVSKILKKVTKRIRVLSWPDEPITVDDGPLESLEIIEKEYFAHRTCVVKEFNHSAHAVVNTINRLLDASSERSFDNMCPQLQHLVLEAERTIKRNMFEETLLQESIDRREAKLNPRSVIQKITNTKSMKMLLADIHPDLYQQQTVNMETAKESFHADLSVREYTSLPSPTLDLGRILILIALKSGGSGIVIAPTVEFYTNDFVSPYVCRAMNAAYETGYFPVNWATGVAHFIPKRNSSKCRVIVVQHPLGTALQNLICTALDPVIYGLRLNELREQHGFMSERGVQSAVYAFHKLVKSAAARCAMMMMDGDIAGAFDSVPWPVIEHVLDNFSIPTNIKSLIMTYLKHFSLWIDENGGLKGKRIQKGFPQGSVVGPYLWTLITAMMAPRIKRLLSTASTPGESMADFILYADDVKIVLSGKSCHLYQYVLDGLDKIVKEFGLSLNKEKTKIYASASAKRYMMSDESVKFINLLGLEYYPSVRCASNFWKGCRESAKDLALAISPFVPALKKISRSLVYLMISQCIYAKYSHCLPTVMAWQTPMKLICQFWDVEGIVANALFNRGCTPHGGISLIYTGLLFTRTIKSVMLTILSNPEYNGHPFILNSFDRDLWSKWYSRDKLKYAPLTNIRVAVCQSADIILVVKVSGRSRSLRCIIQTKKVTQKWEVYFDRGFPPFDIMRIGVYTILLGFASDNVQRKFHLITRDNSLARSDGCLMLWNVPGVKSLSIEINKEAKFQFLEKFNCWKADASFPAEDVVGNTRVKLLVSDWMEAKLLLAWKKLTFSEYLDLECWKQLFNAPATDYTRTMGLRVLMQFLGPAASYCVCENRGIVHYICECPTTHTVRGECDSDLLDYLKRSVYIGKFFSLIDHRTATKFLSFLRKLFKLTHSKVTNMGTFYRP